MWSKCVRSVGEVVTSHQNLGSLGGPASRKIREGSPRGQAPRWPVSSLRGRRRCPAPPLRLRLSPLRRQMRLRRWRWCCCCWHPSLLCGSFAFAVRWPSFLAGRFPFSWAAVFHRRWYYCCCDPFLLLRGLTLRCSPKVFPFRSPQVWTLPATQGRQGAAPGGATH